MPALRPAVRVSLSVLVLACAPGSEAAEISRPTFEKDVVPILTRSGCNSGPCHGKARGQNGFALSLLAYDADFDFDAIIKEARGRRLFPSVPEESLLLRKATGAVPHGGGKRLDPEGEFYRTVLDWVRGGTPRTPASAPKLLGISVTPSREILGFSKERRLKVTAKYSDGATEDVTRLAAFQSNESAVVAVNPDGLVKAGPLPGEAAISARFQGFFATCEVMIPLPGKVEDAVYDSLPKRNFIDDFVWKKLKRLGHLPSEAASDEVLHRRLYLDVIGRLPSPDETRTYLADKAPDKRERLIDRLLERPEYADFWANKWADLLRPNPYRVGIKAVFNLDGWIRASFRENKPYDRFVREIVASQGSTFQETPATIFRDRREPEETTTMIAQLFLGIRLECAKCHHHPFEVWGQDDFYGMAAFFSKVGRKGTGLSPPISGSEEIVFTGESTGRRGSRNVVKHPLTNKEVSPKPLYGEAPAIDARDGDPRVSLATWITAPENKNFARVISNRVWADLMGRGIVEPVDDIRATNPPSNAPLLDALADEFRRNHCDLKRLIRVIANSHVYSLSSTPNDRNVTDTRNYSRHYRQRLRAEVLLDAVCDVTQVPEKFEALPAGSRASAVWTHRTPSLFLDTFGRPDPNQDPPCERTPDGSVTQALHLMNAPGLNEKVAGDEGRAAALAKSGMSPRDIVEEIYLWAYSRYPSPDEIALGLDVLGDSPGTRRRAVEDLLWALLNTPEFVFKD